MEYIKGFKNKYSVTKEGQIYSHRLGRFSKLCTSTKGYLQVYLSGKAYMAHRIVAQTFLSNPDNKTQVNHKNGIKTDNRVENLEWCTGKENIRHAFKTGLRKIQLGEDSNHHKLTNHEVRIIKENILPRKEYARRYKVSISTIALIINGLCWSHIS